MPKADAQASHRVQAAIGAALGALTAGAAPAERIALVAFSGGLDSTVLLHALAGTGHPARFHAVHIHHDLQAAAEAWPAHCSLQAQALGVGFSSIALTRRPVAGESIEAWARRERYAALSDEVRRLGCAVVMMAHHADDQAETVLLRLARGAGVQGLGAMATARGHGGWQLVRPLLALPKADLLAYAQAHQLTWIEDPSNDLTAFARNRVRREVLPALIRAVPGAVGNLNRAARLAQEAQAVLAEVAAADLAGARLAAVQRMAQAPAVVRAVASAGGPATAVSRDSLRALTSARRRLVLRAWVADLGLAPPSEAVLLEMLKQLIDAASAYGEVAYTGVLLCRYRDWLWTAADAVLPELPLDPVGVRWQGEASVDLAGGRVWVSAAPRLTPAVGEAGKPSSPQPEVWLSVRALPSSTRVRLQAQGHSRSLKRWHQQLGIPARLRASLPGVFIGERLAFVAGLGTHHEQPGADRSPGEPELVVRWAPIDPADPRAPLCALQQDEATRV